MWNDGEVEFLMGLVGGAVVVDFGLDPEEVKKSIQQTLNEFVKSRELEKRAALKRCTFEVIEGGKSDQGDI